MIEGSTELSAQEKAGRAFPVSWDQFHRDCRALTWRLNEAGPFHAVVAITRGGLVPAAIVARELGIRIIDTVCVASYDHTKQGDLNVLNSRLLQQELLTANQLSGEEIDPIAITWGESLTVSFVFIAVMLGLACWRFSTKDY